MVNPTKDEAGRCFQTLAEAESYLTEIGFHLKPGTCDWRNAAGDDTGPRGDNPGRTMLGLTELAWLEQNSAVEVFPGPALRTPEQLAGAVRKRAWGHHASCSNPMGVRGDGRSVVDSRLRVHGTTNLRVVDASVFPRIPGLFPAIAVYTLAEKAAAMVLAESEEA